MAKTDQDAPAQQPDPAQSLLDVVASLDATLSQADRAKFEGLIARARGESSES